MFIWPPYEHHNRSTCIWWYDTQYSFIRLNSMQLDIFCLCRYKSTINYLCFEMESTLQTGDPNGMFMIRLWILNGWCGIEKNKVGRRLSCLLSGFIAKKWVVENECNQNKMKANTFPLTQKTSVLWLQLHLRVSHWLEYCLLQSFLGANPANSAQLKCQKTSFWAFKSSFQVFKSSFSTFKSSFWAFVSNFR